MRSGIIGRLTEYAAPTGLDFILDYGSTEMPRLRHWISFWDVNPARCAGLCMNCPGGTFENSPAFQRRDVFAIGRVPQGQYKLGWRIEKKQRQNRIKSLFYKAICDF